MNLLSVSVVKIRKRKVRYIEVSLLSKITNTFPSIIVFIVLPKSLKIF